MVTFLVSFVVVRKNNLQSATIEDKPPGMRMKVLQYADPCRPDRFDSIAKDKAEAKVAAKVAALDAKRAADAIVQVHLVDLNNRESQIRPAELLSFPLTLRPAYAELKSRDTLIAFCAAYLKIDARRIHLQNIHFAPYTAISKPKVWRSFVRFTKPFPAKGSDLRLEAFSPPGQYRLFVLPAHTAFAFPKPATVDTAAAMANVEPPATNKD